LVAVEAMAAGTPVVVTRVGALPEVVTDGRTGLVVEPGNAGALAEALDKVVGDPVLQKRYGAAGRARARTFTASSIMPKVLEGYRRAVGTMASSWRL
jgi:glycosyltransferase involved in cell wall biosynthesis